MDIDGIAKELDFLKSYVSTLQGIELLEYYDSTRLSGNPKTRGREKMELCTVALKGIESISYELGLKLK